jgi:hypothetical protein
MPMVPGPSSHAVMPLPGVAMASATASSSAFSAADKNAPALTAPSDAEVVTRALAALRPARAPRTHTHTHTPALSAARIVAMYACRSSAPAGCVEALSLRLACLNECVMPGGRVPRVHVGIHIAAHAYVDGQP